MVWQEQHADLSLSREKRSELNCSRGIVYRTADTPLAYLLSENIQITILWKTVLRLFLRYVNNPMFCISIIYLNSRMIVTSFMMTRILPATAYQIILVHIFHYLHSIRLVIHMLIPMVSESGLFVWGHYPVLAYTQSWYRPWTVFF